MLKLSRTQDLNSNIFYVSSESKPGSKEASHIVVKINQDYGPTLYFCDCRDFMIRHLPLMTYRYLPVPCKHGAFVESVVRASAAAGVDITSAVRK
jgi:hypothetical protein